MKFVIISNDAQVIGPFKNQTIALGRLAELKVYSEDFTHATVTPLTGVQATMRKYKTHGLVPRFK